MIRRMNRTSNLGATLLSRPFRKSGPAPTKLTPEQRHKLIEMKAYAYAEKRGFQNGDPLADWLRAEKEVDSRLGYNA
jgi:hypothetical protein